MTFLEGLDIASSSIFNKPRTRQRPPACARREAEMFKLVVSSTGALYK